MSREIFFFLFLAFVLLSSKLKYLLPHPRHISTWLLCIHPSYIRGSVGGLFFSRRSPAPCFRYPLFLTAKHAQKPLNHIFFRSCINWGLFVSFWARFLRRYCELTSRIMFHIDYMWKLYFVASVSLWRDVCAVRVRGRITRDRGSSVGCICRRPRIVRDSIYPWTL